MKKISIIMMALALVMGMSQCKKNEEPTSNNNENRTLNVLIGNGNNSKLYFGDADYMGNIPVMWNSQDIVYVAAGGHVIGYLYCAGSAGDYGNFSGNDNTIDVNDIPMNQYLQFFCLGAQIQYNIQSGNPDQLVFSYADQSEDPAVVFWGTSEEKYAGVDGVYHCYDFHNCNALVKFALNTPSDESLTIQGVKNQMLIKFDGTFEDDDTEGNIITWGMGNVRYATVPVNQTATDGKVFVGATEVGTYRIPAHAESNKCIKGRITLD